MPDMLVSPSLLAADFLHLDSEIAMLSRAADWIHLDVMDGTFVPNISFGFSVLDAVAKVASKPMDVHLMTVHPERWFERLASLGASCVSFHLDENYDRAAESLYEIRSLGMKAGLALMLYIIEAERSAMSVFAGFGGQKFSPATLDRIAALRRELDKASDPALIEVDGGVGESNAALLHEAGAGVLVAGSSVFKSPDPEAAIRALRAA